MPRQAPLPRRSHFSLYSPGGETATVYGCTWVEPECFAYPGDTFTRRAYARLEINPHNPVALPYGEYRVVLCKVADTYSSIPARLRIRGKTVAGYLSVKATDDELSFTPEADPEACHNCAAGEGCKQ